MATWTSTGSPNPSEIDNFFDQLFGSIDDADFWKTLGKYATALALGLPFPCIARLGDGFGIAGGDQSQPWADSCRLKNMSLLCPVLTKHTRIICTYGSVRLMLC